MTQKELLYLEDAINHEQSIIGILNSAINNATNKKIIKFLESELVCHTDLYDLLMKHMEDTCNE